MYIYCYTNKINGHTYVGQTNNIERRKREHRSQVNNIKSKNYNDLFHKKLREYGEDNFSFEILEILPENCSQQELDEREIYWIEQKESFVKTGKGYNLTTGGSGNSSTVDRILNDDEVSRLIKEIKEGVNFSKLSNKYGIAISYISLINHGLSFRQKDEVYPLYKYYRTNDDYNELIDLLLYSDLTLKQIAEKLNIGYSTVKKINAGTLRKDLYTDYPIRKITPQQRIAKRVQDLLMIGASNLEIIKETGISSSTISRINSGQSHYDSSLSYPLR